MPATRTLADLSSGASGTLADIRLPAEEGRRLMAMGFIPGIRIQRCRSAPGGDPIVYLVDGAEIAIRRETARRLMLAEES